MIFQFLHDSEECLTNFSTGMGCQVQSVGGLCFRGVCIYLALRGKLQILLARLLNHSPSTSLSQLPMVLWHDVPGAQPALVAGKPEIILLFSNKSLFLLW